MQRKIHPSNPTHKKQIDNIKKALKTNYGRIHTSQINIVHPSICLLLSFCFEMLCVVGPGWDSMSSQPTFGMQGAVRRSKTDKILLPRSFAPTQYSVICGRGKAFSAAPGNQWLRKIVSSHISAYAQSSTKIEKSAIVSMIVSIVKKASPDGGAFVCFKEGRWWEEQEAAAREKVGCYLRDAMPTKYRSSTKAKLERRRAVKSDQVFDSEDTTSSLRGAFSGQHRHGKASITASPAANVNSLLFDEGRLNSTSSTSQTGEFLEHKLDPSYRPKDASHLQDFQQTSNREKQLNFKLGIHEANSQLASFPRSSLPDSLRDSQGLFGAQSSSPSTFDLSTMPAGLGGGVQQQGTTSNKNSNIWASSNNSSKLSSSSTTKLDQSSTTTTTIEALYQRVGTGDNSNRHDVDEARNTGKDNIPTMFCDEEMLGNLAYGDIANLDDDAISNIFES